jgi:hypothetical protein
MKKIFLTVLLSAAAPLWAAEDKLNDMKPEVEKKAVAPTGVEWQNANDKALAAETSDDALAAVVADYEAAENLLAKIKGAYLTDAMVATKIAAVTQYVMAGADVAWYEFWRTSRNGEREIWCRALIDTAKKTDTAYIKEFCLDQLRWCAKPSHIAEIKEIGSKADKKEVADFAALVARELENLNSAF